MSASVVIHDQLTAILQWVGSVGAWQEGTAQGYSKDEAGKKSGWREQSQSMYVMYIPTLHTGACTRSSMDMWGHTHACTFISS